MARTFWLSFCDGSKPKGSQFLGACIVDVSDQDAREALGIIALKFPNAMPDSEWVGAASRKAHTLGCNPGGEMMSVEIDADNPNLSRYTKGVLMDKSTVERLDENALAG